MYQVKHELILNEYKLLQTYECNHMENYINNFIKTQKTKYEQQIMYLSHLEKYLNSVIDNSNHIKYQLQHCKQELQYSKEKQEVINTFTS